jgi:hypothetical protein
LIAAISSILFVSRSSRKIIDIHGSVPDEIKLLANQLNYPKAFLLIMRAYFVKITFMALFNSLFKYDFVFVSNKMADYIKVNARKLIVFPMVSNLTFSNLESLGKLKRNSIKSSKELIFVSLSFSK